MFYREFSSGYSEPDPSFVIVRMGEKCFQPHIGHLKIWHVGRDLVQHGIDAPEGIICLGPSKDIGNLKIPQIKFESHLEYHFQSVYVGKEINNYLKRDPELKIFARGIESRFDSPK